MIRQCAGLGLLMIAAGSGPASDPADRVLRGLTAVSFSAASDVAGATAQPGDAARRLIRSRLEAEGVPLVPSSPTVPDLALAYLLMTKQNEGTFTLDLQLFECVRLVRQPEIVLRAATWSSSAMDASGGAFQERLDKAARKVADDFVRAWKRTH
jgi:hypothetical protein